MTDETHEDVQIKRGRKPKVEKSADDIIPIKLLRDYRPMGDFLIERDDEIQEPGINEDGYEDYLRVKKGNVIHVPRVEARRAINLGIAERADEL